MVAWTKEVTVEVRTIGQILNVFAERASGFADGPDLLMEGVRERVQSG